MQRIKLGALEAMRLRKSVGQPADLRWKSADQNALGILLVGVEPPLPACKALVGESQAGRYWTRPPQQRPSWRPCSVVLASANVGSQGFPAESGAGPPAGGNAGGLDGMGYCWSSSSG